MMDTTVKMPSTQRDLILAYMKSGQGISNQKALSEFRCYRLSAVIHRLRNEGWKVRSVPARSFTNQKYIKYFLV